MDARNLRLYDEYVDAIRSRIIIIDNNIGSKKDIESCKNELVIFKLRLEELKEANKDLIKNHVLSKEK